MTVCAGPLSTNDFQKRLATPTLRGYVATQENPSDHCPDREIRDPIIKTQGRLVRPFPFGRIDLSVDVPDPTPAPSRPGICRTPELQAYNASCGRSFLHELITAWAGTFELTVTAPTGEFPGLKFYSSDGPDPDRARGCIIGQASDQEIFWTERGDRSTPEKASSSVCHARKGAVASCPLYCANMYGIEGKGIDVHFTRRHRGVSSPHRLRTAEHCLN